MAFEINGKLYNKTLIHYVPHGIDSNVFKPLPKSDERLTLRRKDYFGNEDYKFVLCYNSRNVHRKRTSNVILAFRTFCDNLTKEESSKCCLILHTEIMSDAGTDLLAVKEALCPDYKIIFSPNKIAPEDMCCLYNLADVTICLSSNEGFGLSTAESIMCGTPIIVNVTGGLQDLIGQVDDEGKPVVFNLEFGSNFVGKYKNHGVWAKPLWPAASYIQGSIPTPYILDDLCKWEDAAEAMMYWYRMTANQRELCGMKGREWAMGEGGLNAKNMCKQFCDSMDFVFEHWRPSDGIELVTQNDFVGHRMPENKLGFAIPTINLDKVNEEINKTVGKLQ